MRILMIGDIYGENGRKTIQKLLPDLIKEEKIDFVIGNGENVTHGKSIIKKHYDELKESGIDVITSGNHIFKHKEVFEYIDTVDDLLKPMNMNSYTPGKGYTVKELNDKKICIVNLMGTSFMDKANNPYEAMDEFLSLNIEYDLLLVDFHAEATAEKMAFAWNYDGIISGFVGTHTHVQTADLRTLPKGTLYLTDLGMTGAYDSIIGANPKEVIYKEKTGLPSRFTPAKSKMNQLCGVIYEFDENNKPCASKRVFKVEEL